MDINKRNQSRLEVLIMLTSILGMAASVTFVAGIFAAGVVFFGSWAYTVLKDLD